MLQSQLFYKSLKKPPRDVEAVSHQLLLKGDFIAQETSGVYSFLPLGLKVHKKIENIIRQEMDAIGGQEVFLPTIQSKKIWQETGRWNTFKPPLFKFKDTHGREYCLGPTHEEVLTILVKSRIKSYKDLPKYLYQIQNKFRNEMRSTGGLLRTREFIMKDLYSFDASEKESSRYYKQVLRAYSRIYKRCGLKAIATEALAGSIGGQSSHEFMAEAEAGEDKVLVCPKCHWAINKEMAKNKLCALCKTYLKEIRAIEVGHIFKLGPLYSKKIGAYFTDKNGKQKPIIMGCYGIGLGRLMATIVEVHHDEKGIIWPKSVTPFDIHLIRIMNYESRIKNKADEIYRNLLKKGFDVLYDDRDESPGVKFAEADLIGIPLRIVVSEKTLAKDSLEIKKRGEGKVELVKIGRYSSSTLKGRLQLKG